MTNPSRTRVTTISWLASLTLVTLVPIALQAQPAATPAPEAPPPAAASAEAAPAPTPAPPAAPAVEPAGASDPEPEGAPQAVEQSPAPAPVTQAPLAPAAPVAAAAAAPEPAPDESLVPPDEAENMADRPADYENIKFKLGKGLEIKSNDGDYSIQTRLRAQLLYEWLNLPADPDEHHLQIRRARLQFQGNVFGKNNFYKVELSLSPRDEAAEPMEASAPVVDEGDPPVEDHTHEVDAVHFTPLLDWYFQFNHLRDASVRIGQYKIPYSRQRVISSADLQFVDRAITNNEFNLDRDIGFDVRSADLFGWDALRYYAGVYLGEGRNRSDRSPGAGDQGFMYLVRLEALPFGMFDDYEEADFERSSHPRLSIGAAYAFIDEAAGTRGILGSAPSVETDYHNITADLVFMLSGFSLFSDFYLRSGETEDNSDSRDGWGAMAQAAYLIPRLPLEFGFRYGVTRAFDSGTSMDPDDEENELRGVISWYFAQHTVKLQADFGHLWTEDGSLSDGENVLRIQTQIGL